MRKIVGLALALVLTALSTASADSHLCSIRCSSGASYNIYTSSHSACCDLFGNYCGFYGSANWQNGNGDGMWCLNFG